MLSRIATVVLLSCVLTVSASPAESSASAPYGYAPSALTWSASPTHVVHVAPRTTYVVPTRYTETDIWVPRAHGLYRLRQRARTWSTDGANTLSGYVYTLAHSARPIARYVRGYRWLRNRSHVRTLTVYLWQS